MSALLGERDRLIMSTVPRYATPMDRALMLTASATMFEVSLGGVPTPASITFSALMLGALGEITFSSEPAVPLTVANGNAVLNYADMTASIVTVTATAVIEGVSYRARQTVAKTQALDLTPPPAPTGLAATGHPATITLAWNAAPANYKNLSHTEVWRAPTNNFAQAALVGRADGREYTDPVGPGAFRYYWIRYMSRAAIPGPYNASSGTVGGSDAEVEHLLQVLTEQITESQLYADLGEKIDLIVPTRDAVADLEAVYGDTVSAATSAAQAVQAAADAALKAAAADAAAGGASQYASQANLSATNASTAAGAASTSASQSSQAATAAGGSAAAAESAASTAANAAGAAGASASAASTSKEAAAGSATTAGVQAAASSQSAIEAKAAQQAASGSASAALQSAGTASASSTAAGDAASQAATSANLAVGAKNTATGAAASASQSAGAAGVAETNAAGSASQAASSAQLAAASNTAAGGSAAAAAGSASTAGTKSTEAGQSAEAARVDRVAAQAAQGQAAGFAQAASGSASTADARATAAGQSATAANNAATTAGTSAGQAGAYQQQAAQSATNANGSATSAASTLQQVQAVATGFDAAQSWNFDATIEGWSASGATQAWEAGSVRLATTSSDPNWLSPPLAIAGINRLVRARVKRLSGATWDGQLFYSTAQHGYSAQYRGVIPDATVAGEWRVLEWDMGQDGAGGADWLNHTITSIRMDLGAIPGDDFLIDWVTIGRIAPQAYTAAIRQLAEVTANSLGEVGAKYAVQVDADNVAGGFEVIAGGGRLDFGVRAGTFFIAAPAGSGIASAVPFIVRTTETIVNGEVFPIGMYVANAFIQNAAITNAKIGGDIWSSNFIAGQSGWRLYRSGDMEINNLRARGSILGGAFTNANWPVDGATGFWLGADALRMGNYYSGKYFEVGANGDVYAPGLTIINGSASFGGRLSGATGSFSGNVLTGSGTGFRVEMGPDDPVYAMWAGSGAKTDTNAIFYLKRNGAGYFGGSLSAGVLKTAVTNPAYDPAAQVVDGPFGSNGGTINVVCGLAWRFDKSSRGHTYTVGSGSNAVTIRLYRTIGAGAEELVQSSTFSGSTSIVNSNDPDTQSTCTRTIDGSFTYTDTAASTQNRIYRAVVAISQQSITMTPRPGGGGEDPDAFYQRLTIITTE